jgi:phosphoheptose isomerase
MPHKAIDLRKVKTVPLADRKNLVTLDDMIPPDEKPPEFESSELDQVVKAIIKARKNGRTVIWMMGAHVIKSGLGMILIDLMERGFIDHVAGNGAVSIHDFELALIGETSEDVATSIEDGTFGMAEETGTLIHQALRAGAGDGLGYGESLGRFIAEEDFAHKEASVLFHAWQLGIPLTIHVTIGADIIHQHPDVNFGILGAATGHDFRILCQSVAGLDEGVFLNFGTAVTGPEVFLKALSIARNLGFKVEGLTTANFDLYPLGQDYREPVGKDRPEYYYRPRKNVVNRPTSLHGEGYHIQGDHRETIPNLHQALVEELSEENFQKSQETTPEEPGSLSFQLERVQARSVPAAEAVRELVGRRPELEGAAPSLCQAYLMIAGCFERGGCLYLAGNGGSMADALHISGELMKSYARKRPLDAHFKDRLNKVDPQSLLSAQLEGGLRAVVLGLNPSLNSAVDNDFETRWLNIAQELQVLARPGDVFLGVSTSGRAMNILFASQAARAVGMAMILLTGEIPGEIADFADIVIAAPGEQTDRVQESHIALYHCLCEMLEVDFFGEGGH